MNEVQKRAIPGVKCGKCLGRIDGFAIDFKAEDIVDEEEDVLALVVAEVLGDVPHRGPDRPPSLCSECLWAAIVNLSSDESETGA